MAAISGKDGKVSVDGTDIAEVTGWTLERTSNNPAWASSSIPGRKQRVAGVQDASGTIEGKLDVANTPMGDGLVEGGSVTLNLYVNATQFFVVPALIDSISFECDMDEGEVVSFSAAFSHVFETVLSWPRSILQFAQPSSSLYGLYRMSNVYTWL